MTRKVGFIFLFSNQIPLKPYSNENKDRYVTKILLHSFGLVNHIFKTDNGFIKTCLVKEIESKKHVTSVILNEFNLKKSYIVDYNPIPKKFVKSKEKNLTIYAIILNSAHQEKILNLLKESTNAKLVVDRMLLSYKLESIDADSPDIFTAIKNYSQNKNIYSRKIELSDLNQSTYKLTLNDVIEGLCGIEEFRKETKCYI
jgi:hypothetical protein